MRIWCSSKAQVIKSTAESTPNNPKNPLKEYSNNGKSLSPETTNSLTRVRHTQNRHKDDDTCEIPKCYAHGKHEYRTQSIVRFTSGHNFPDQPRKGKFCHTSKSSDTFTFTTGLWIFNRVSCKASMPTNPKLQGYEVHDITIRQQATVRFTTKLIREHSWMPATVHFSQ